MPTHFAAAVAEWQGFYTLAGGASATLMGLIFVAVSIQLDVFKDESSALLLATARRTFARFIIALTISLLFLVPEQSPIGLGVPLLCLAVLDMRNTVSLALTMWRPQPRAAASTAAHHRSLTPLLPLISGVGITVTAITIILGYTDGFDWMVGVVAVILANAAQESWNLMFALADTATRKATPPGH